jgi:hypothetical protein
MKCGWGCDEQLTGRNTRAHFTIWAKRRPQIHFHARGAETLDHVLQRAGDEELAFDGPVDAGRAAEAPFTSA